MVHSYHVYNETKRAWLADDEHSWENVFSSSASITSHELAIELAERECGTDIYYILAWVDG